MDKSKLDIRNKLSFMIRKAILKLLESDEPLPQIVCDGKLEEYGWTLNKKLDNREDLQSFIKTVIQSMKDSKHSKISKTNDNFENFESESVLLSNKYLEAESEYNQIILQLIKFFEEAINHQKVYCSHFQIQCKNQEKKMDMLLLKSQFLKLQFILKLYGEENALRGHLELQSKLLKELEFLKSNYNELVNLNQQYELMRSNQHFIELFKTYKELKKIEKRTEIIGKM